jgi:hypothetical protein
VVTGLCATSPTQAWHDKTHLTVAKLAGLDAWYNAAAPDLAKIKAGEVESYNHWFNNNAEAEVTEQTVLDQIARYNHRTYVPDAEGHLYGAIIASLRAYDKDVKAGKFAYYHLAYCAHYIGDLSQPLHHIPFDSYNKSFHEISDGIVEKTVFNQPHLVMRHTYVVQLSRSNFERDLARHIARIANISRNLGDTLRAARRNLTREEAYVQLGHSVSLLRAIVLHYK